jgi:hypothetical protein
MRKARQNELGLRVKIPRSHGYGCVVSSQAINVHYTSLQLSHFGSSAICWTFLQEEHLLNSPILKIGTFFIVFVDYLKTLSVP